MHLAAPHHRTYLDPRYFQILSLALLLWYGLFVLRFDIHAVNVAAIILSSLGFQFIFSRMSRLHHFDSRSALISALSLCLLLRSNSVVLLVLAAGIAIGSKFIARYRGKHIFNPTNFGIVCLLLVTDQVWVSTGQWGSEILVAFAAVCFGALVVNRAARSDVTIAFLVAYSSFIIARGVWLGDPLEIALHRLGSGAFLIFSFFMISDPKTTPDAKLGRLIFAVSVAALGYVLRFHYFMPNGLLYSLVVCSLGVPVLDRIFPGPRYRWERPRQIEKQMPSLPAFGGLEAGGAIV